MVVIRKVTAREVKREWGEPGSVKAFTYLRKGDEPVIYLPHKVGTGVRIHELYHARPERQIDWDKPTTADDFIREELEAILYTREKKGQEESIPGADLQWLLEYAVTQWRASKVMSALEKASRVLDLPLTAKDKAEIWELLRRCEAKR